MSSCQPVLFDSYLGLFSWHPVFMALAVSLNILSLTLGEAFSFSAFLKIREMGAKKASSSPETYRIGGNVVNYQGLEVGEGLFLLEGLKGKRGMLSRPCCLWSRKGMCETGSPMFFWTRDKTFFSDPMQTRGSLTFSCVYSSVSAWLKLSFSSHLSTPRSSSALERPGFDSTGQGRP